MPSPDGPQMNSGFTIVLCDVHGGRVRKLVRRAYDEVFKGVVLYVIAPSLTLCGVVGIGGKVIGVGVVLFLGLFALGGFRERLGSGPA